MFKNHKGKVKSISWFDDDLGFVSTALDQNIYIWSLKNSNYPEYFFKNKGTNFDCVEKGMVAADQTASAKSDVWLWVYACGTDKTLWEIVWGEADK